MNTPKCYGAYGTGDCQECEFASWCRDAGDLPLLEEDGKHWQYNPQLDGWYWMKGTEDCGGRLSKLLAELLYELDSNQASSLWEFFGTLSALSQEKPRTYSVVRLRILNPQATYQELADELGMQRQGVENHLKMCAELVPELRPALVNPLKPLRKNRDERFSIRCSGNHLKLYVDDKHCLSMPMDDENNVNALPIVDALNSLHWRRREALIEELMK